MIQCWAVPGPLGPQVCGFFLVLFVSLLGVLSSRDAANTRDPRWNETRAALKDPGCPPWQSYLVFSMVNVAFFTYSTADLSSCGWCIVLIWACSGQDSGGLVPQCLCYVV